MNWIFKTLLNGFPCQTNVFEWLGSHANFGHRMEAKFVREPSHKTRGGLRTQKQNDSKQIWVILIIRFIVFFASCQLLFRRWTLWTHSLQISCFPTCQVRVVRFYQSCSPRLAVLLVLRLLLRLVLRLLLLLCLLLQFLLDHVCINFHLNFRLANSSPSSLPTSQLSVHRWTSTWDQTSSVCTAGPQPGTFPAQCAPLDLNLGPSQLSVHCWTSTWDQASSVCTAGPQPGTFPAQCAPLDLNLGPSQLSVHRWTSTWDLPSSVCTAGPQRPDRIPEDMPDRVLDMSDRYARKICQNILPEDMPGRMPEDMPEDMLDKMPEDMSDRMPEDLPVTKRINVMVGITRSKEISALRSNIEWQCAIAKQAHVSTVMRRRLISQINLSFPFPSFPFLSRPFPFLSLPFPSFPFLSLSFPFFPFLSLSFRSFPVLSIPFPSFPFLSLPFPSFPFLSRMRSKGSRCPTVRNPSQPFARLLYGRASGKFSPEGVIFAFRVASVALRDIQTCFVTCRKSFCVAGALLLRRFQKMRCSFRGRRHFLDVSIVILRGRRTSLDASCCVFFTNRIGRAASSGDKVQIPWQTWFCEMCWNWRKPPTKHRFWGSKFKGSDENS